MRFANGDVGSSNIVELLRLGAAVPPNTRGFFNIVRIYLHHPRLNGAGFLSGVSGSKSSPWLSRTVDQMRVVTTALTGKSQNMLFGITQFARHR